jgi:hypothetical protein
MSLKKITKKKLFRNSQKKRSQTGNNMLHALDNAYYGVKRTVTLKGYRYQQKIKKNTTLKMLKEKQIPLYKVPFATVRITLHALKWTFVLLVIYICLTFIVLPMNDGMQPIRNVIIYGFIGYIAFFMAYLGWLSAQNVINIVNVHRAQKKHIE